eukprot:m.339567 g.339567  ORF g.339567 m.339567 type:complete len:297 (+) comp18869_c0_seq1:120-1010(+)
MASQNASPQLKLLPKAQWVPDKKAKSCMQCQKIKFGMNHRRHHCRVCGQVVCQDCSNRRHPTFPEVRICSRCYSKIIVASNKLQNAAWYHGPLTREKCEKRLQQPGTRLGDFLVRESASVDGYIALSVRAQQSVLHYLIKEKYGHWYLGPEPTQANQRNMFPTIQALITEYKAPYNLLRAMIVENHEGDTCPNCAANVNPDMEFCEECGTRLRSTAEQMQVYEDQGQQELVYDGDVQFPNADGVYDDSQVQNWGQQQQLQPQVQSAPTQGSKFCSACGNSLKPGAAFCAECGTPAR